MRGVWVVAALLFTGCTTTGNWVRPGADAAATAREYGDCRALAAAVVKPEADINQDILATRQTDWQRSQVGLIASERLQGGTRDRAAAIVETCMQSKGFSRSR